MNTPELINTQEGVRERESKFSWERVPIMPTFICVGNQPTQTHRYTHRQTHTHTGLVGVVSAVWLQSPLCPEGDFPDQQ